MKEVIKGKITEGKYKGQDFELKIANLLFKCCLKINGKIVFFSYFKIETDRKSMLTKLTLEI